MRPRVAAGAVRACATAPGDDSPCGHRWRGWGRHHSWCVSRLHGSRSGISRPAGPERTVVEDRHRDCGDLLQRARELALDRLAAEQPYLRCLNRRRRRLRLEGLAYDRGTRSRRHRPTVTGDSGNLCTLTRRTDRHDPSRPRLGDLQQRDHRTALYGLAPQTLPIQISGTIGLDNHHNMKH